MISLAIRRVLMLVGVSIAVTVPSLAQELSIGSATIAPGGAATVSLDISGLSPGVTALGTYDLNIGFNPSVVSFGSASYGDPKLGDQLNLNGFAFQATTTSSDTTELFELSLDPASALLSSQPASFTLATVTFDALGTGSSGLTISVNALGDANGNSLPATLQNGVITVGGGGGGAVKAPEIDASVAMSALTLLFGSLLVLCDRSQVAGKTFRE